MDRKSVQNDATQARYAIFLNPVDICGTATVGEISILALVAVMMKTMYSYHTKAGQIDLLLDFDGPDNIYTPGQSRIMISRTVTADEVGTSLV